MHTHTHIHTELYNMIHRNKICVHASGFNRTHSTHTCVRIYIHVCASTYMCAHLHTCVRIYIHVCASTYMCAHNLGQSSA